MAKKKVSLATKNVYLYTYVTKEQKEAFQAMATGKGTTLSGLMRNVLEDYIKREKTRHYL